jgi:hypothetical protein
MIKKKNLLGFVAVLIVIPLLAGCVSLPRREEPLEEGLAVAEKLRFDDVPVPSGFKLLANESFAFQNENIRVGLLKYTGRARPEYVVNFYREQMPMYNWNLLNIIEYGRRVMNFEKENQTCIVTLEATVTRTNLTISVAPKSVDVKRITK